MEPMAVQTRNCDTKNKLTSNIVIGEERSIGQARQMVVAA